MDEPVPRRQEERMRDEKRREGKKTREEENGSREK